MSKLPVPTMSATMGGVITNRVKIAKRKQASTQTVLRRYRTDPLVRGMDTAIVSISMPAAELAALDELAEQTQMARSHLIRQAVKHFAEKLR